ncbi:nitroreductase family protein [Oscillibacter sp. MSJ-2]|uniref:Nitroreductase family protein n=1 Tax=Dysosmobacter acutus TaxID=2841504 RepID=A0ABS6FC72_9FIRM|nr:nitroreductase family protein [Dysosmobacter acutus]MBU5627885.1 nitroreductase family protein [Dysosmobacter acutus]
MDIEAAIKNRRSVRNYLSKKVAISELERIVDMARYAPTSSNSQAWKFQIVTDDAYLKDIVTFSAGIWKKPPAILAISMDRDIALKRTGKQALEETIYYDAGIAAYAASLEAQALGLGSCIIASFNKKAVAALLAIEPPLEPMLMLTLGYFMGEVKMPAKRGLNEVLDMRLAKE